MFTLAGKTVPAPHERFGEQRAAISVKAERFQRLRHSTGGDGVCNTVVRRSVKRSKND
jgi:hypothetical protein